MRARGWKHGLAIKRGHLRLRQTPPWPTDRQLALIEDVSKSAAERAGVWRGLVALLGELRVAIPDPDELEQQLRLSYKRGYVQALHDVRREGWRQELMSYKSVRPVMSVQEAATISHAYDNTWKGADA